MGGFTFVKLVERLERNNFVHPLEMYYHSKTSDEMLHYWPRDWRDMRTNGWQKHTNLGIYRGEVHLYTLDSMYFTINGEIRIWLGVRAPESAGQWEIIDVVGGKPNTSQLDGGIMYDFHPCSMLQVYQKILQYAGEWVKS